MFDFLMVLAGFNVGWYLGESGKAKRWAQSVRVTDESLTKPVVSPSWSPSWIHEKDKELNKIPMVRIHRS